MQKQFLKKIAICLILYITLFSSFSMTYQVLHTNHKCSVTHCETCKQIQVLQNLTNCFLLLLITVVVGFYSLQLLSFLKKFQENKRAAITPVALKIRANE